MWFVKCKLYVEYDIPSCSPTYSCTKVFSLKCFKRWCWSTLRPDYVVYYKDWVVKNDLHNSIFLIRTILTMTPNLDFRQRKAANFPSLSFTCRTKLLLHVHGGQGFPATGIIVVTVTERFQAPVTAYIPNKLCHLINMWTYLNASYFQTGCNVVDLSSKAECPSLYVLGPLSKWFILYLKRNFQVRRQDNPEICGETNI